MLSPENIQKRFESGLEILRPTLFHFADKLVGAYSQRRWNLLIGDDTSGRLVTRFARLALKQVGIIIPTRYIAASKSVNTLKPDATFDAYAKHLAGDPPTRGLIITETVGKEASSISFAHRVLKPYCKTLDIAALGIRAQSLTKLEHIHNIYWGSKEVSSVQRAIWQTFENPTAETDIDKAWSGPLTNLVTNFDTSQATAMKMPDKTYQDLTRLAYKSMDALALEWGSKSKI